MAIVMFLSLAGQAPATESYSRLKDYSSEQLMKEGRQYFEQEKPQEALIRFMTVGKRYRDSKDPEEINYRVRALNNAACVYQYFYYDYMKAYDLLTKAYNLCEETGNRRSLPIVLGNLGDLYHDYASAYNSQGMKQRARDLFDQTISMAVKNRDWEVMTTAFYNLSTQNYDLELDRYKEIFSKEIPDSTPDIQFIRLQYLGVEQMQKKDYPKAREYFSQQPASVTTPMMASRDTLYYYLNMAKTYELENDWKNATENLEDAYTYSSKIGSRYITSNICLRLSEIYGELGDKEKEDLYHLKFLEEIGELHKTRLNRIGEMKYISDLNKEDAKEQAREQRRRYFIWINTAIGLLLLLSIFSGIMIWRKNKALKARNKMLFEKYQQLLEEEEQDKKYQHSQLTDDKRTKLVERIEEVMSNPENISSSDFTLKQLSNLVDSNTTYISQVINETYGCNFNTLLGQHRVKEVCLRINEDKAYSRLTIEAIANSVGFKSRTTFINAFKREVGLTPSEYIRMARARTNEPQDVRQEG